MAKYSVPKYGDGTRYGVSTETTWTETGEVKWIFQVDWNNDGSYEGTNEAAWMMDCEGRRGRQYYVRSDGKGFEPVQPGEYTLTMDNTDGRYDPYNTSSPLYPNVKPGHKAKLAVKDIASGTVYTRIVGEIDDIRPISGTDQVRIVIVDGMKKLSRNVSTGEPSYMISADDAISKVLDLAHWGGNRSIQSSDLSLMMLDLDNQDALDVINGIAEASLGTFFISKSGTAKYYSLNYNSMTTHNIDQSQILKEIQINQPWDEIRNDVLVKSIKWVKTGAMTIWTLAAPQYIGPGETVTFTAEYDPAMDLAKYSYTANDAADGSGLDRTVYVRCGRTIRQGSTRFTFINYYMGGGVYLTSLRIYGRKLVEITTSFNSEDSSSQSDYGVRSFLLDSEFLQDNTHAAAYADTILDHLKDPLKIPIIQIQQRPSLQFSPDLFDKVALTVAKKGISDTFRIGMIEDRWLDPSGQSVLTTLYLQDVIYSAESIGTDPPTLAIIPEDPTYGGGPGSEPEPPEGPGTEPPADTNCITDLEYPANGPYTIAVSSGSLSMSAHTWTFPYHCWLRKKGAVNLTRYQIDATWKKLNSSGVFTDTTEDDFYDVYALDKDGNRVAIGIKDPIVGTGEVRTGYFEPPAAVEIYGLEIDFGAYIKTDLSTMLDNATQGTAAFTYAFSDKTISPGVFSYSATRDYIVAQVYEAKGNRNFTGPYGDFVSSRHDVTINFNQEISDTWFRVDTSVITNELENTVSGYKFSFNYGSYATVTVVQDLYNKRVSYVKVGGIGTKAMTIKAEFGRWRIPQTIAGVLTLVHRLTLLDQMIDPNSIILWNICPV